MRFRVDKLQNHEFMKHFMNFVVVFLVTPLVQLLSGREQEEQGEVKRGRDRERREYGVVRAYFTFFNLAFSMPAQQTTAFCFELGRNQTEEGVAHNASHFEGCKVEPDPGSIRLCCKYCNVMCKK